VELAITRFGAMLGPVTFHADSDRPIRPYAIAPWADTPHEAKSTPPILQALRGDFVCSAFGDNVEPWDGRPLPPHGDTANNHWRFVHQITTAQGSALRLELALPIQGGQCVATTVLLEGHQFVYQRHDFSGLAVFNPGHHAMLRCSERCASTTSSFGPHVLVGTPPEAAASASDPKRSRLQPGCLAADAASVLGRDGARIDATRFPGPSGMDDTFMICADPALEHGWSAATFHDAGYVWLALRNSAQLPSTFVWLSNGGRSDPPWNSRHSGVLGLEDMMGYYGAGLAASARINELNARGIATCRRMQAAETASIPYIQGVMRIPGGFDVVASVKPAAAGELLVTARNGCEVRVPCRWEFLRDVRIPQLCEE
jgi:hypothetical protein